MFKETSYEEKFNLVQKWHPEIIESVKKDLKNEHLKVDKAFLRRHFLGRDIQLLDAQELAVAYQHEVRTGNVGLCEFIITRWILKHADIYNFFEEKMRTITADFESLEILDLELSSELVKESTALFGAENTYLFSIFNSVVFPASIYEELRLDAEGEILHKKELQEKVSHESYQKRAEREISALKERFEKKLNGLQKKYLHDVEKLKKEIAQLKKKEASQ